MNGSREGVRASEWMGCEKGRRPQVEGGRW
jgi:hypothetical protein